MLRLQEKPAEWIKFTAVMGLSLNGMLYLLWQKEFIPGVVFWVAVGVALAAIVVAMIRPYWFRGFYRGGMRFSFETGQIMGKGLLIFFFFFVVTPMGLMLRLLGKDLLQLKKTPEKKTYWQEAKNNRDFERMF